MNNKQRLLSLMLMLCLLLSTLSVASAQEGLEPAEGEVELIPAEAAVADAELTIGESEDTAAEAGEAQTLTEELLADKAAETTTSADDVPIDENHFPDANLREEVLYWEEDEGNGDGVLSADEIEAITSLHLYWVDSLKGIEYLTGLEAISICDSKLAEADFSALAKLRELTIQRSKKLHSLNVSGNPKLMDLDCRGNRLTALDVSGNPELESLLCSGNGLTSLDVSGNPKLMELDCEGNRLTALDVSGNPELEYLWCNGNGLTSLDVSGCPKLMNLQCEGNAIASLDLSGCAPLVRCISEGTALTYLGNGSGTIVYEINLESNTYTVCVDGDVALTPTPTAEKSEVAVALFKTRKSSVTARVQEPFIVSDDDMELIGTFNKFTSSNKSVLAAEMVEISEVDEDGDSYTYRIPLATPLKAGKATLTLKGSDGTAKMTVTVVDPNAPQSVEISEGKAAKVAIGETLQLNARVLPGTARQGLTYKSGKPTIAEVDESGLVKGVKAGKATITVSADNGKKATIAITVYDATIPTGIALSPESATIDIGKDETLTLTATLQEEGKAESAISWKSSKTKVAKVSDGVVTPVAPGTAKITATTVKGKKKATTTVTVVDTSLPKSIRFAEPTVTILKGEEITLVPVIEQETAKEEKLTWKTKSKKIATVTDGVVKGVKAGKTTITVKTRNKKSATVTVVVKEKP